MVDEVSINRRAADAKALLESPAFNSVVAEILDDAAQLFLSANSGIDILSRAHEGVRAVQKFKDVLQARLDAEKFLAKGRGQDRASD